MTRRRGCRGLAALFLFAAILFSVPAWAVPEKCPRLVASAPIPPLLAMARPRLAAWGPADAGRPLDRVRQAQADVQADVQADAAAGQVALTFLGHASFLIESPGGVSIVTDYNDYVPVPRVPDVVTMNHAHDTHYSFAPDPRIAHVLRGWNPDGGPARHELTLDDVWIRNVPTNLRDGAGTESDGNSIFVFEVAGLCIAHLGHLHHLLTPEHLAALGRIDVVLAPVDGSHTLDLDGMAQTLASIGAPLVIPMHYFSRWGLDRFLDRLGTRYAITSASEPMVRLSRTELPKRPTVLVLPGR